MSDSKIAERLEEERLKRLAMKKRSAPFSGGHSAVAKRSKFRHHGEFEGEFESFLELMSDKMSRSSHLRFIAWGPGALKWHRSHSSPCQLKDILTILGHKTKKNVLSSTNLKHIACGSALVDIKWFIEDSEITAHEVTSSLRRFGVVAGLIFNSAVKDKIESFAIRSSRLEKKMEPADLMKYYNTALQNFFFDFLQLSESLSDRMHGSDSEILLFWSTRLPTLGYSRDPMFNNEMSDVLRDGETDFKLEKKIADRLAAMGVSGSLNFGGPTNSRFKAINPPKSSSGLRASGKSSVVPNAWGDKIKGANVPVVTGVNGKSVRLCVNLGILFLKNSSLTSCDRPSCHFDHSRPMTKAELKECLFF